jgi:isoquinoline 1-oxidoreductase
MSSLSRNPESGSLSQLSEDETGSASIQTEADFERYELRERAIYDFDISRRDFCRMLGGGLLVLLVVPDLANAQDPRNNRGRGRNRGAGELPDVIGAWIRIAPDGSITAYTGKAEMGQGIRTSLSQAIADELQMPATSINLVMADTALTPYDRGTFGSRTTPTMAPQLRRAAVAVRDSLKDLAAGKWGVPREQIIVKDGKVSDTKSGKSFSFSDLTSGLELTRKITTDEQPTPGKNWTIAGKPLLNVNARDIVTGKHQYPSDVRLDNVLYGRVVRPAQFNAELKSADTAEAKSIHGVVVVQDGNFLGVAAPSLVEADAAVAKIHAEWSHTPQISNDELFQYLKDHASDEDERSGSHANGSRHSEITSSAETETTSPEKLKNTTETENLAGGNKRLHAAFHINYIAHAPLETRAAVAQWKDGKLLVYVGTQRPFGVKSELVDAFGLGQDAVQVITPDTGAAYGGKHTGEVAIEAARLARAAGKPVKLVWSRHEEFTWAYFRPAGVIEINSAVDPAGKIAGWEFHNWNSGNSGIRTPYDVPNEIAHFHPTKYPLRQGSYRGLAATANNFARESHMDEIADSIHMDPLKFRLINLKDPRLTAVLKAAAEKFGWADRSARRGHGYGLACASEKGGYVAACAEVEIEPGATKPKVLRLVTAFECGAIVNPKGLENQVQGAAVQALGGAFIEKIEFKDGKVLNASFSQYDVPRFSDLPKLETVLLDRPDLPSSGAGECPLIAAAPAIANAIFNATGKRIRTMPMSIS